MRQASATSVHIFEKPFTVHQYIYLRNYLLLTNDYLLMNNFKVKAAFAQFDTSGDDKLDYREFCEMINKRERQGKD